MTYEPPLFSDLLARTKHLDEDLLSPSLLTNSCTSFFCIPKSPVSEETLNLLSLIHYIADYVSEQDKQSDAHDVLLGVYFFSFFMLNQSIKNNSVVTQLLSILQIKPAQLVEGKFVYDCLNAFDGFIRQQVQTSRNIKLFNLLPPLTRTKLKEVKSQAKTSEYLTLSPATLSDIVSKHLKQSYDSVMSYTNAKLESLFK
jgi:hypothetical protein